LLALLDNNVVPFAIEDIASGSTTRGHRFLGRAEVRVPRASDYAETLRGECVLVDVEERREEIRRQVLAAASALSGVPTFFEEQLEENLHLVEFPTAFVGRFREEFLRLPEVVLTTVMRKQQRYFPVAGPDGKLLPAFIGVRNGGSEHIGNVAAGNEIVVTGRFRDAAFFFERDRARPLGDRVPDLDRVVFLHGLGRLGEKARRVASLCALACEQVGADDSLRASVRRAAELCKADLTTSLVIEFTSLQGVIGGVYAELSGEAPEVAAAIGEHYRPATAEDSLPATRAGTILSLADKLDTVAGVLWKGEAPTGTADPHGVRRRLQGIAAMLFAGGLGVDVQALSRAAFALYGEADAAVLDLFDEMLLDRANAALSAAGIEPELRNAVLSVPVARWGQALAVARAVGDLDAAEPDVLTLAWRAATRPGNIVGKRESDRTDVDTALFEHESEGELLDAVQRVESAADAFDAAIAAGPPEERFARIHDAALCALRAFAGEAECVDRFFEAVMVMAEDDALRDNRLALLYRAHLAFTRVVALHHLSRG
jgi:glycyl-tRNA synthetase beta chain